MHYIERGEHLARRKAIYEEIHPETKRGAAGGKASGASRGTTAESAIVQSFGKDTAAKTGVSPRVIREDIQIARNLTPEAKAAVKIADIPKAEALKLARMDSGWQKVIAGKITTEQADTVKAATQLVKREEIKTEPPKPLSGKYSVIYADSPWKYDFAETESRAIENQYPTMTLEEIKNIQVPCEDNAVLYLWTTAPKYKEAIEVMEAWGFEYKTCAVWDKEKISMGYWFRGQHELLLVGVKGKFSPPSPEKRESSVYREARGAHSRKPDYYYDLIESMFPNERYLEMFARQKHSEKWAVWGNQVG